MGKTFCFLCVVFLAQSACFCANRQSIVWDNELTIGSVSHKLYPRWRNEYNGLPYEFTQSSSAPSYDSWESEFEQKFLTSLGINPFKGFYAETSHEFLGNYADRYYMSVNDNRRMESNSTKTKWVRGFARYNTPVFNAEVFRGFGNSGWTYENDMFGFYPEQHEQERYRRIDGSIAPRGGSVNVALPLGKLDVVAGDELLWGYGPSIFTKYSFNIGKYKNTFFYKREEIPYGDPGEDLYALQFVSKFKVNRKLSASLGLMYQPFRQNLDYTDTSLNVQQTKSIDTWGGAAEVYYTPSILADELSLGIKHRGILAGNVDQYTAGVKKTISDFYGAFQYTYRKPVEAALPLIYEGTAGNPGNLISAPRGRDEAFRVDRDNRDARILKLVCSYDPTPKTWFYQWKQDSLYGWNLNPLEDAVFATAVELSFEDYMGSTDRLYYYNSAGELVYEPVFMPGLPPTKRYLPRVKDISVVNIAGSKFVLEVEGGESMAGTVLAVDDGQLIANYFKCALGFRRGKFSSNASYARDYWGPEDNDWHKTFGFIIDRLYRFNVQYSIAEYADIVADYLISRRFQNVDMPIDTGSFQELFLGFKYRFGANLLFEDRSGQKRAKDRLKKKKPQIGLSVVKTTFSPDGDGVDDYLDVYLDIFTGMTSRWMLVFLDESDRIVSNISGRGMPPEVIRWDGVDMAYGQTLSEGEYIGYLQTTDYNNQTVMSDPVIFAISYND